VYKHKKRKNIGLAPGTFSTDNEVLSDEKIFLLKYNQEILEKTLLQNGFQESLDLVLKDLDSNYWFNSDSLACVNFLKSLQEKFEINSLVLEDIVNSHQRPKFEDWNDYLFIVLKMMYFNSSGDLVQEQVSFILKNNCLISIQEQPGDTFISIRTRLDNNKSRIKKLSADYLLYSLLDSIIDNYFIIIDSLNETIELLEEEVLDHPSQQIFTSIQEVKRKILLIKKSIQPVRELVANLLKTENELINDSTKVYIKDLYDHCLQINDSMESLKEGINSVIELVNIVQANKMNEVVKVLTMISTIFIPLSFIAGIYGMNFENMPELKYEYAYFIVLLFMLLVGFGMLYFFKRKKWL
jgi:magnesium transporter